MGGLLGGQRICWPPSQIIGGTCPPPSSYAYDFWGGRVVRRCWVNFQCQGVLLIWIIIGQGPIALAVGAGRGCSVIFSHIYHFSSLPPSLWETPRYRLKYCLKGPLNPIQPTKPYKFQQIHVCLSCKLHTEFEIDKSLPCRKCHFRFLGSCNIGVGRGGGRGQAPQ